MALRAIDGKLRGSPAREAASRAFSYTCEHCGKMSSRIAGSLGQNNEAIEDDYRSSKEFKEFQRKQYIIRSKIVVTTLSLSWLVVCAGTGFIEDLLKDDENSSSRK